eukprot:TRINITY_DN12384_c0_g1_i3.p2 TRINITY_DN12384_c0_g1~~TRINITY_DN12384_c0_g1_i3.p2  ORF type:complete len:166 (-),score=38.63 TRINITY_DN12384_c0_g1_i3:219-716(-)
MFFFSSRRRHTRFLPVSWARRCVQETGYQRRVHGQYGNGKYQPKNFDKFPLLEVNSFDYTPNLIDYIKKADLIISHCGAGTILECLKLNKILIGVVNTTLMNNHQLELFEGVVKRNYAYGINDPENITENIFEDILSKYDKKIDIIPYPTPHRNALETVISSLYN